MSDWDDVFGGASPESVIAGIEPPTPDDIREREWNRLERVRLAEKSKSLNDPEATYFSDSSIVFKSKAAAHRWMSSHMNERFSNSPLGGGKYMVNLLPDDTWPINEDGSWQDGHLTG